MVSKGTVETTDPLRHKNILSPQKGTVKELKSYQWFH
jgi:hypothetical protein